MFSFSRAAKGSPLKYLSEYQGMVGRSHIIAGASSLSFKSWSESTKWDGQWIFQAIISSSTTAACTSSRFPPAPWSPCWDTWSLDMSSKNPAKHQITCYIPANSIPCFKELIPPSMHCNALLYLRYLYWNVQKWKSIPQQPPRCWRPANYTLVHLPGRSQGNLSPPSTTHWPSSPSSPGCQILRYSASSCQPSSTTSTTPAPPTTSISSPALNWPSFTTTDLSRKIIMCLLSFSKFRDQSG